METANQREYFRYTFPSAEQPRVELSPFRSSVTGHPRSGYVVNLSVSGVDVRLDSEISPHMLEKLWAISLLLPGSPDGPGTLLLNGTVAHVGRDDEGFRYGLEFFGIEKPSHAQQRQALWRFLLHCQKVSS